MSRKKLTLDKVTLGVLSDSEKKGVVGGAGSSRVTINTVCTAPPTYGPTTSIIEGCTITVPQTLPDPDCTTAPYKTCAR